MTQKRKVGPGGGDFALNPNRFSGGGGGKSIVTGKKSTVSKKVRGPQKKMTKKQLADAEEKRKNDAARKERDRRLKKQVEEGVYQGFNPRYVDKLYEEKIMKPARNRHKDN
jgi:hypothetical protein